MSIEYGRIKMHTLLRQFGRENSRKQFVHHGVTKRQLLVDTRDIYEVLSDDTIVSVNIALLPTIFFFLITNHFYLYFFWLLFRILEVLSD